jgi:integrase
VGIGAYLTTWRRREYLVPQSRDQARGSRVPNLRDTNLPPGERYLQLVSDHHDRGGTLLFDHYLERLERRGRSPLTKGNYCRATSKFLQWLFDNNLSPESVEPYQVEEFFDQLPHAPSTKRLMLANIRAAYRYAHRRGMVPRDPTFEVDLPEPQREKPRILSSMELRRIRDNCYTERQALLFHMLAYTGCRRNEIRLMRWSQVSLEDNTLSVHGKGDKYRLVPIHPALGELLSEAQSEPEHAILPGPYGEPLSLRRLWGVLRELTPTATCHDFRRTAASSLDANGVEESLIFEIMGWAPKTIFGKYYRHVASERLQQAILQLYRNDPL